MTSLTGHFYFYTLKMATMWATLSLLSFVKRSLLQEFDGLFNFIVFEQIDEFDRQQRAFNYLILIP